MAASEDRALATSWPGELPFQADLLREMIARHAPVIRFHPDEPYFPSSVEWYLERCLLIEGSTGTVAAHHPAASELPKGPATSDQLQRYWLTLDPAIAGPAIEPDLAPANDPRRGDLASATAYVRALHDAKQGHTDLQFWMFYPYDGPGLARLRPRFLGALRTDRVLSLWPAGMHEADWELAVIRIDHATLQPVAAFLSQHQNGDQHVGTEAMSALEREPDGRIGLHASLYGHASYAHPQERKLLYFKRSLALVGIDLGLIDQVEAGAAWDLSQPENHQVISTSWHDPQFPEPTWLDFAWRWGAYDPTGGRFRRKLVEAAGNLLESHLSPPVLLLHVLTLGLTALLLALAPRLLGGPLGAKLLGHTADNSGPFGPSCHEDKWSGAYNFTGPHPQPEWIGPGTTLAQRIGGALNTLCQPPVWLLGRTLRLLVAPLLPRD